MVIIAIMYNESGGALIRTQSAEPERALNEVAEWFARDLIEQGATAAARKTRLNPDKIISVKEITEQEYKHAKARKGNT